MTESSTKSATDRQKKRPVSRILRYSVGSLVLSLFLTGGYALHILETNNFHDITFGEAYRSAQLDRDGLEYYIKKYGIKSVLNLRGRNSDKTWYIDEIKTCSGLAVEHYDVGLSAYHEPDHTQVRQLLEVFRHAKRPILIHCRGGADRSGLVSAMWKEVVDGEPKSNASQQLTIWYGHFPIRGANALDRLFENWNPDEP